MTGRRGGASAACQAEDVRLWDRRFNAESPLTRATGQTSHAGPHTAGRAPLFGSFERETVPGRQRRRRGVHLVGRASLWKSDGFTTAFSDAYRMPGYPLIILIFQETLTDNPYLALKVFQVILFSLSVLLIKSIVSEISVPRTASWVTFAYAILPIWHFTPVLLAESLTTVLFTFTLFLMTRLNPDSQNIRKATLIGLLV